MLLYLIRHGRVVEAERRRLIGHLDVPLSPEGEAEVSILAERLAPVPLAAVYSSDLARARRSAELIAAPHGLMPRLVPSLRELALGRWEGLTAEEIRAREPEAYREWMARIGEFRFPEGESLPDLAARAWAAVEGIRRAHPEERVAIVAHGGTIRVILCQALGLPLERVLSLGQDYSALSLLEWRRAGWRLRLLNQTPSPLSSPPVGEREG